MPAVLTSSDAAKARALLKFRDYGNVSAACTAAKIGRTAWYEWLKDDPAFAAAVAEARESVGDKLEEELQRRAIDGGDTTALIFALKALRPDKYRETTKITVVHPDVTRRVEETVRVVRATLPPEWADKMLAALDPVWA